MMPSIRPRNHITIRNFILFHFAKKKKKHACNLICNDVTIKLNSTNFVYPRGQFEGTQNVVKTLLEEKAQQ